MAISNEKICAALIQGGTVKAAAGIAKCSERTVFDRLRNDENLQSMYAMAKSDIVRGVVSDLQSRAGHAISVLDAIALDEENPASTRVAACKAILDNLATFSSRLQEVDSVANKAGRDALTSTILSLCGDY